MGDDDKDNKNDQSDQNNDARGNSADVPGPMPGSTVGPGVPAQPSVDGATPGIPKATHKGSKGKTIGIIIAILILLAGGGAAAYFGYYLPHKPDNILKKALVKTFSGQQLTSEHLTGSLSAANTDNNTTTSGSLSFASNRTGAFDLSANVTTGSAKFTFDAKSQDGSTVFLRVNGLNKLISTLGLSSNSLVTQSTTTMFNKIDNQWIEIDKGTMSQLNATQATDLINMSSSDRTKLANAYSKNQFLRVKQTLADQKIGSLTSYHFKVLIDKNKLKSFVSAIKSSNLSSISISNAQKKSLDSLIGSIDFNKYPVDVWIDKNTMYIDQVSSTLTSGPTALTLRLTVTDFNKSVEVVKPTSAKTLMQLLGQ
ncbi:MAG TPA: hypothetical protein VMR45_01670 [Patescibacteria group bacterium]|nr:hypothetical protein [Patescibacteria group bacterium]